jgi:predicted nicotinamide N-methyase
VTAETSAAADSGLAADAEWFVRSACALGPVPGVPEIRLYLAADAIGLWQRTEDDLGAERPPPFWAFAWPGGQALARYALDHAGLVAGRRVLDLDAEANGVPVPVVTGDVLDGDGEDAQVVLAGDVWYSRPLAGRVLGCLERARARGAVVLTGDIGRAFLPRERFRELDAVDVPVLADLEDASVKRAMVWTPAR